MRMSTSEKIVVGVCLVFSLMLIKSVINTRIRVFERRYQDGTWFHNMVVYGEVNTSIDLAKTIYHEGGGYE